MAADVPGQMLDDGAYLLAARRLPSRKIITTGLPLST
jgi:hypothetical protein